MLAEVLGTLLADVDVTVCEGASATDIVLDTAVTVACGAE